MNINHNTGLSQQQQFLDLDFVDVPPMNKEFLYAAIFSVNWISYGFALAFSANSAFIFHQTGLLSSLESGIYASVLAVGGFMGSLIMGLFLRKQMSYKYSTLISCILATIGWYIHLLITPFYRNDTKYIFTTLIIGRIIVGISAGISASSVPVCVSLSVSPGKRHYAGLFPPFFLSIGYFLAFLIGYCLIKFDTSNESIYAHPFRSLNLTLSYSPSFGIFLALISTISTLIFPDELAQRTLSELSNLSDYDPIIHEHQCLFERLKNMVNLMFNGIVIKQILVGSGVLFFQQMFGINAIIFNAISLLSQFMNNNDHHPSVPSFIGIFIGLIYIFSSFISFFLSKFFKPKTVLYVGSIFMFISHLVLSIIFSKNEINIKLGATFTLFFIFTFCCTWGPFPWTIISEMFTGNMRNIGITLSTSVLWVSMFLVTLFYAFLSNMQLFYIVFILFSIFSVLSIIFVAMFLPDTKNLTIREIQNSLLDS